MLINVEEQELQLINTQLQSAVLKYLQTARTDLTNSGLSITSQIQGIRENNFAALVFTVPARLVYPVCGWLNALYATELGGLVHTRIDGHGQRQVTFSAFDAY